MDRVKVALAAGVILVAAAVAYVAWIRRITEWDDNTRGET